MNSLTIFSFLVWGFWGSHLLFAQNEKNHVLQKDQLIFAIDLIRHGDRTPIASIPKDPYYWPEGLGELTPLGMRQEYELGKKCRRQYVDMQKLLPGTYRAGTLSVRSTDFNRTLDSASCFLMGLYPPGTGPKMGESFFSANALPHRFQPIPIHTAPKDNDPLLLPKVKVIIDENVFSTSEWKNERKKLEPHFFSWSEVTGIDLWKRRKLALLADTLYIYRLKHLSMPKKMSLEEVNSIINTERKTFTLIYKNPEVGKVGGGPLLRDIASHLKEAARAYNASSQNRERPILKYLLFSAHDTNILELMSAMHVPLDTPPPYASDLSFLLYSRIDHSCYIRLLYNGKPIMLSCSHHDGSIPLQLFLSMAASTKKNVSSDISY